ncbi:MAG: hypothetical protein NDI61_00320 [Bdellovibrionaceae bacterium]|nr:hypothetical protein [Pseudobdellovibrionaceae bacterium]
MGRLPIVLSLAMILGACSQFDSAIIKPQPRSSPQPKPITTPVKAADQIRVLGADGQPLANARVLIGTKADTPFSGNILSTNTNGDVACPPAWVDPLPVTIEATGHVRTTFLERSPGAHLFQLRATPSTTQFEVSGETVNFGRLAKDGYVDAGLVVPAVSRGAMLNFQISSLISPQSDWLSLPMGKSVQIPANLTLPSQRESYIVPITLDKPRYRIPVAGPGTHRLVALHGRLPLKQVIDDFNAGRSMFDILNALEIQGSGTRDITVTTKPVSQQNIAVDQIRHRKKMRVRAPAYDPKLVMLALSLIDDAGLVYPADIKKLEPNQIRDLNDPANTTNAGLLLSLLRARDTGSGTTGAHVDEFTAVVRAANLTSVPEFIPLSRPPEVRGTSLVLHPPTAPTTVDPHLTYASLTRVVSRQTGSIAFENKTPEWDVFADGWISTMDLPDLPSGDTSGAKYRWEVFFLGDEIEGQKSAQPSPKGPAALESISHVSKNAVDLP